jgi:hypothetical protein
MARARLACGDPRHRLPGDRTARRVAGTYDERLAERTGAGVGGLLNATFGNAAEMIIALTALRRGLLDVVKASSTGAIIGNLLLLLGVALLAGGLRHPIQTFNAAAARSQATMLVDRADQDLAHPGHQRGDDCEHGPRHLATLEFVSPLCSPAPSSRRHRWTSFSRPPKCWP